MRLDPVVFPALEEGRASFALANELLAAPAVARRTLLDRVFRSPERLPSARVRDYCCQMLRTNQGLGLTIGWQTACNLPVRSPWRKVIGNAGSV
jgi:hypothetical protein